jgi:hypothetical protein
MLRLRGFTQNKKRNLYYSTIASLIMILPLHNGLLKGQFCLYMFNLSSPLFNSGNKEMEEEAFELKYKTL